MSEANHHMAGPSITSGPLGRDPLDLVRRNPRRRPADSPDLRLFFLRRRPEIVPPGSTSIPRRLLPDRNQKSCLIRNAAPRPGRTYILIERSARQVLAFKSCRDRPGNSCELGLATPYSILPYLGHNRYPGDHQNRTFSPIKTVVYHWHCVESEDGWLAFQHAVTGAWLGQDKIARWPTGRWVEPNNTPLTGAGKFRVKRIEASGSGPDSSGYLLTRKCYMDMGWKRWSAMESIEFAGYSGGRDDLKRMVNPLFGRGYMTEQERTTTWWEWFFGKNLWTTENTTTWEFVEVIEAPKEENGGNS